MLATAKRAIFTVSSVTGGWAVERDGVFTDASPDKSICQASAAKLARAAMLAGESVQVKVQGDTGYF